MRAPVRLAWRGGGVLVDGVGQRVELAVGAAHVDAGDGNGEQDHEQAERHAARHDAVADLAGHELLVEGVQRGEAVVHHHDGPGQHPAVA
nr:hypothetical protein [Pseudoduganella armeniaca]